MFDQLSERLQSTLSDVRSRGKLNDADVDRAMREIRLALLEADVNFKVVKQFTSQVKERCLGAGVLDSLNPGQQVVKIVNEELAALMGGASRDLALASSVRATARSRWPPATSTGPRRSTSSSPSASTPAPPCTSRAPTATRSTSPSGLSGRPRPKRSTC